MKIDLKIAHRKFLLWVMAFVITVAAGYFQRKTGPTYSLSGSGSIAGTEFKYRLERAEVVGHNAPVRIFSEDTTITASIRYKRFKTADKWEEADLLRDGSLLEFGLPTQPAAGKMIYTVTVHKGDAKMTLRGGEPVIVRYRGDVPAAVLLAHILVIFLAMLFSNRAGLEALDSKGKPFPLMVWTLILFFIGGFILGPLMQKYAFGVYWAGFPFGTDLTDNKTLLAFVIWIWALFKNLKSRDKRGWVLFASVFMFLIYLIPHSVMGSELDYGSGVME